MIVNTTVNATSLKTPYTFAKILPSSSASVLVASDTTVDPRITAKTTDDFADSKLHMASASVPTTIETPTYESHKSLLTFAPSEVSQSSKEIPKTTVMKMSTTSPPLSKTKSTSFTTSEFKYVTSFERTVGILESSQTSYVQRNVTKAKSITTEKPFLPYLTVSASRSSPFSSVRITSAKNLSEVLDAKASDWSKILTQTTIKPYFNLTEHSELQDRTLIDFSHSSGEMALSSPSPMETQTSLASTDTVTTIADKTLFGTVMHTLMSSSSECVV